MSRNTPLTLLSLPFRSWYSLVMLNFNKDPPTNLKIPDKFQIQSAIVSKDISSSNIKSLVSRHLTIIITLLLLTTYYQAHAYTHNMDWTQIICPSLLFSNWLIASHIQWATIPKEQIMKQKLRCYFSQQKGNETKTVDHTEDLFVTAKVSNHISLSLLFISFLILTKWSKYLSIYLAVCLFIYLFVLI